MTCLLTSELGETTFRLNTKTQHEERASSNQKLALAGVVFVFWRLGSLAWIVLEFAM